MIRIVHAQFRFEQRPPNLPTFGRVGKWDLPTLEKWANGKKGLDFWIRT